MLTNSHKKSGFTLIELLIVVGVSVILMLAASALFMTFLISNTKVNNSQLVKEEGQFALKQMEFLLRNAIEILPNSYGQECTNGMSEISFKSLDGGITTLNIEDDGGADKIASNSGVYLTSDAVELTAGITFNCSQEDDQSHPHVELEFTLRKGTPGLDKEREIAEETFRTSTTLRSL